MGQQLPVSAGMDSGVRTILWSIKSENGANVAEIRTFPAPAMVLDGWIGDKVTQGDMDKDCKKNNNEIGKHAGFPDCNDADIQIGLV